MHTYIGKVLMLTLLTRFKEILRAITSVNPANRNEVILGECCRVNSPWPDKNAGPFRTDGVVRTVHHQINVFSNQ